MSTNYLIPAEITTITPNELLTLSTPPEEHTIFLKELDERIFLELPISWENTLNDVLGKVYNDGYNQYTFYITRFDGKTVSTIKETMAGYAFKNYLIGLLKSFKTITLHIISGVTVQKLIICMP